MRDDAQPMPALLTLPELAAHLEVTPEWLREAMAQDDFPCAADAGEDALFDLERVRAWLRRPLASWDES